MTDCAFRQRCRRPATGPMASTRSSAGQRRALHVRSCRGRCPFSRIAQCQQWPTAAARPTTARSTPTPLMSAWPSGRRVQLFRLDSPADRRLHDPQVARPFQGLSVRSVRHCLRRQHRQRYGHHAQHVSNTSSRQSGRSAAWAAPSSRRRYRSPEAIIYRHHDRHGRLLPLRHQRCRRRRRGSGGDGQLVLGVRRRGSRRRPVWFADTTTLAINNSSG